MSNNIKLTVLFSGGGKFEFDVSRDKAAKAGYVFREYFENAKITSARINLGDDNDGYMVVDMAKVLGISVS